MNDLVSKLSQNKLSKSDLSKFRLLSNSFYMDEVNCVARNLMGKVLVSKTLKGGTTAIIITEVEAYAQDDMASHSYRGKTLRNAAMFEKGGTCYVYRSYGIHHCLNVVTGNVGQGEAVLIRAGIPLHGIQTMIARQKRRDPKQNINKLCKGPGRLSRALGIDVSFNGLKFGCPNIILLDADMTIPSQDILQLPRVGISKAKTLPWRYEWQNPPAEI